MQRGEKVLYEEPGEGEDSDRSQEEFGAPTTPCKKRKKQSPNIEFADWFDSQGPEKSSVKVTINCYNIVL